MIQTEAIAGRINDGAAPGHRVSDESLKKRVQRHEGVIRTIRPNKPPEDIPPTPRPKQPPQPVS